MRRVLLLLLEENILSSLFIIQTCLYTGKLPEVFHADCVYGHFFFLGGGGNWGGMGLGFPPHINISPYILSSSVYENVPEVTNHCHNLTCLFLKIIVLSPLYC